MKEPPSPAVLRLLAALEEVVAEPIDGLPAEPLGADLIALRSVIDRLEAVFTRRLGRFGHLDGQTLWGCGSVGSWLRHACRMRVGRATQTVEMARHLEELPAIDRAFSRGELGLDHVTAVVRVAGQVGDEVVRGVEPALLESAATLHVDRFRLATRYLRHIADADGAQEQANELRARQWLQISQTLEDMWILDGRLSPENGLMLTTALDAIMGPPAAGDHRTTSERRAEAVGELAKRGLDSGSLPVVGGQKPHLLLVASVESLRGLPGALPPELACLGPVPPGTARRLACDATIEPIIDGGSEGSPPVTATNAPGIDNSTPVTATNGPGVDHGATADGGNAERLSRLFRNLTTKRIMPLASGTAVRLVPPSLRRAVVARDRACRGCEAEARWCDCHHIIHWTEDGPTELWNLVLLCRRCHTLVHDEGYAVELLPDGQVRFTSPAGRVLRGPPRVA